MDGYIELANAIIIKAAKDYKKALIKLNRNCNNTIAKTEKQEIERFFKGSWFKFLTKVSGETLMKRIQQEVNVK